MTTVLFEISVFILLWALLYVCNRYLIGKSGRKSKAK